MARKVLNIVFILAFVHALAFAQNNDQVKLISSNDDYGLELDWMQTINSKSVFIPLRSITFDKNGNLYVCGRFNGNLPLDNKTSLTSKGGKYNLFIAKFDSDGNLIWAKTLYLERDNYDLECMPQDIMMMGNDYLVVNVQTSAMNLYYDNEVFYTYQGDSYENLYEMDGGLPFQTAILKIDVETGNLVHNLVTRAHFEIDQLTISKDGYFFLSASMVKDFCGINKDLPSDCRSTGKYDKYYAKLTSDFKLIWDFSINETCPYDEYTRNGSDQILLFGDSLYVINTYCSDIQISPDKDNPVRVPYRKNGEYFYSNETLYNAVFARYNVKGDKPVLEAYSSNSERPYFKLLSTDKDGNLYGNMWIAREGHFGVKFNEDMSYDVIRTMPLGRMEPYSIDFGRCPWFFNDKKDLEMSFQAGSEDTITINDTIRIQIEPKYNRWAGVAKYDSDLKFKYMVYWIGDDFIHNGYYTDENNGNVYVTVESLGEHTVNWNPQEGEISMFNSTSAYFGLVKYTETFRIREELSDKGTIRQAGEMVRYGTDVKIEALPMQGYQTDSVVTHTGYALAKQTDGTFLLPHVTDRVTLKAYYSPATGVAETDADKALVYPNPATDKVHVTTLECFHYVLTDVKGMRITDGETSDGTVDVTILAPGLYLLQIDNDKIVKFEKK